MGDILRVVFVEEDEGVSFLSLFFAEPGISALESARKSLEKISFRQMINGMCACRINETT